MHGTSLGAGAEAASCIVQAKRSLLESVRQGWRPAAPGLGAKPRPARPPAVCGRTLAAFSLFAVF
ncbi:hypothetical protein DVDV_2998 [Desulfovibrio sp. DV]|nr:hypothetical protein DVDV_2998 [Desulfovibrio sp. DV]